MSVNDSLKLESPVRLLLDVNVLLSGVVGKPGSIARELYEQALRGEIRLIFNPPYLSELERVLTYERVVNLGISSSVAFRMAEDLFLMGEYVPHLERFDWPSLSDAKDWYLLDLLYASNANALITRDRRVLEAGERLNLRIFSPEAWWSNREEL